MIEKENKDRLADYYKETLKAKYEFLRIFVLLDLTVGTGLIGMGLKEELKAKEIFLIVGGFIFFFAIFLFIISLFRDIKIHLEAIKSLKQ
jgi:hypothetical protein